MSALSTKVTDDAVERDIDRLLDAVFGPQSPAELERETRLLAAMARTKQQIADACNGLGVTR